MLTAEFKASFRHRAYRKPSAAISHTFTDSFTHAAQSPFLSLQNCLYFGTLSSLVRKTFKYYIEDMLKFKCPNSPPGETGNTHADCQIFAQCLCLLYQAATCFGDIFWPLQGAIRLFDLYCIYGKLL